MPDHDETDLITTGAAAKLLGYSDPRSVHRLLNAGVIAGFRTPGGHWRVDRASVLEARERASGPAKVA